MHTSLIYADTCCALGDSLDESLDNLLAGRELPQQQHFADLQEPISMPYFATRGLHGAEPEQRVYRVVDKMLADALVQQPLTRAERARTGLFLGSSSFDVNVSELDYQQSLAQQHGEQTGLELSEQPLPMGIVGYAKIPLSLGARHGFSPYIGTYSTACTSSANALLNAHRLLQAGLIDHAFVIGLEFFNKTTLLGFHGLSLISPSGRVAPFSARRDGLILGEGCGLLMLSRTKTDQISLCGGATATDNYSLTAANTDGSTLRHAMRLALDNCGLTESALAAIKVHGTASMMSDEAEAEGLRQLLLTQAPPLFALKPYIGHTLGACGALEAALVYGCLMRGQLPFNTTSGPDDAPLGMALAQTRQAAPEGYYGLNYFAFGGNNTCLILHMGPA